MSPPMSGQTSEPSPRDWSCAGCLQKRQYRATAGSGRAAAPAAPDGRECSALLHGLITYRIYPIATAGRILITLQFSLLLTATASFRCSHLLPENDYINRR